MSDAAWDRASVPRALRVATAALSAAATRAAAVACARTLRQTLGPAYAARAARAAALGAWGVSSLALAALPTRTDPAAVAAAAAAALALCAAAGLRTLAIGAACVAGAALTSAASNDHLVFLFAAVAGPVSASLGPAFESAPIQSELLLASSATVLLALSAMFVTLAPQRQTVAGGARDVARNEPANDGGRPATSPFSSSRWTQTSPRKRPRSRLRIPTSNLYASGPNRQAHPPWLIKVIEAHFIPRRVASLQTTAMVGFFIVFVASVLVVNVACIPVGRLVRTHLLRPAIPPGYQLVAQQESTTGLVSVIEDHERGIRFMTCDHSVLGGIYTRDAYFGQNIFGQFHVHEAVRLTLAQGEKPGELRGGSEGRALCIGLGIGVVANALHALGSTVDAIELDPAVVTYARRFFQMRVPNIYVEDAVKFIERATDEVLSKRCAPYNYVVHDVFTGGAVPRTLFTEDTFRAIRSIMSEDSVLAVNFVGVTTNDIRVGSMWERLWPPSQSTSAALAVWALWSRLSDVFGYVRVFSDEHESSSVHNLVFFASDVPERVQFRRSVERDYLDSGIRERELLRFEAREIDIEKFAPSESRNYMAKTDSLFNIGQWVIAAEHWRIIREVFSFDLWDAIAT
jgi:hypothetical protein